MSKKKSVVGTLLTLGAIAGATAVVYYKRNEIRALIDELADRMKPADEDDDWEDYPAEENDIVIDETAAPAAEEAPAAENEAGEASAE